MPAFPDSLRALRHRNFRLFCSGQMVSLIGTWMQMVALSWLVYRLTGKATMLGFMTFCNMIPVFLLAPLGGLVADRVPLRRLLLTTQIVAMILALGLALLTLGHQVRIWHLFLSALLLGTTNALAFGTTCPGGAAGAVCPPRNSWTTEAVPGACSHWKANGSALSGSRRPSPLLISNL